MIEKIPMSNIKYMNEKSGQYWFSPSAMYFFHSRIPAFAYKKGRLAYFISSEQRESSTPRKYSIRVANLDTGNIDIVGGFHNYTKSQANTELKRILRK